MASFFMLALAGSGCAVDATDQAALANEGMDEGEFDADEMSAVDTLAQVEGPAPTAQSTMRNGPHQVGRYTSGYRNGPAYADSTIHYPQGLEGPLPAIAVVPGFVSPQASIQQWGPFLASHGFICMTIGTNSPMDQPGQRANALLDALETIKSENNRSGSPLNGKVDVDNLAVSGWSMGGGGTLIAANRTPTLKAAMSFAGWQPGGRFSNMRVPSIMFAATSDPLAGGQSQGFYRSIPESTPKMLYEVQGGSHNVANSPRNSGGMIGRFGLSWLKLHMLKDERYKPFLLERPSGLRTFEHNLR